MRELLRPTDQGHGRSGDVFWKYVAVERKHEAWVEFVSRRRALLVTGGVVGTGPAPSPC